MKKYKVIEKRNEVEGYNPTRYRPFIEQDMYRRRRAASDNRVKTAGTAGYIYTRHRIPAGILASVYNGLWPCCRLGSKHWR